jgi:hypothetical protein
MDARLFKYISVVFLIFATAAAVLLCTSTGALTSGHVAHDNMPTANSGSLAHAFHAKELTAATTTANALVSIITLLLAITFGALRSFQKLGSLQPASTDRPKQKYGDTPPAPKQIIHSWLSLFEQSPNATQPA